MHPRSLRYALLVAVAAALACAPSPGRPQGQAGAGSQERPSSVILLISDGAGAAHWTLDAYTNDDAAIKRFRTVGLVDTRGADHEVSGSAPTASAYATGVRTFMGAIAVDPDSVPVESVLEVAQRRGKSTGLVTTTEIEDATPAAFGAHVSSRYQLGEIARQMVDKQIDVIMGGGRGRFRPDQQPDGQDLLARARASYPYVGSVQELEALDPDTVSSLLGLLAEGEMGIVAERGQGTLVRMGETALDIVSEDPDGFFLMIENEESDTQSHANSDEATLEAEMADFDSLVGMVLDYQAQHPDVLVLVTGDHETGGMALPYRNDPRRTMFMTWTTGGHTGTLLPLFAMGPGAERFGGIIRNDRVGQILKELVGGSTP